MVDIVDAPTRSRMMAGIASQNTKPEILVRRHLHARGLRFSLRAAGLPGRPDIVLSKWNVAVFVNGCFWHWHGCQLSKTPSSNQAFWLKKLSGNTDRDAIAAMSLISAGWRVAIVWECALRGATALSKIDHAMDSLTQWVVDPQGCPTFELPKQNLDRRKNAN